MAATRAASSAADTPAPSPIVGIGQIQTTADVEANFAQCAELAKQAAEGGACLLFLPEAFHFIGANWRETISRAEPLDGPALGRYRALAREHGLWLSLGGFHERGDVPVDLATAPPLPPLPPPAADAPPPPPPTKAYNTHVVLDETGATRATYRKVHLFDVDIPGGAVLRESSYTAAGVVPAVAVDTPAGRLGLATCYDMRFPEVFTRLARDERCDLLCAPSAFTVPTGRAHWHLLLRARAVENQCYMFAAAQAGPHNEKRRSYGHALAVDPWGDVVGDAGGDDDDSEPYASGTPPRLVLCTVDRAKLDATRARMPIQLHRDAAERTCGGEA